MITIGCPFVEKKDNKTFLYCDVKDEVMDKEWRLWYSVENEFGEYFCPEVADAFVLVMLQLAMKSHQDIEALAPVSNVFLYNCKNTIMPMLKSVIPDSSIIDIKAETTDIDFKSEGVGCGCSLGVDSFSSLLSNLGDDVVPGYKVTHLALFNSGQHGDLNLEGAEKAFNKNVEELKPFAKELGLSLVAVNTNLNVPYKDYKFPLLQRFIQTTISVVYTLQKLFKRYIYATAYSADHFKFSSEDVSYIEAALVPLLRTQNTEIILSNPMMTRVEKTALIAQYDIVQRWLDVCWASQITMMTEKSTLLVGKVKKNCGKCQKCQRTLLTFELMGCLDKFEQIFDLKEYERYRWRYICKVISTYRTDAFSAELYSLMKEKHIKIPLKARILSLGVRMGLYKILQKRGVSLMAK